MIDSTYADLLARLAHDLRSPLEVLRGTVGDMPSLENKADREHATRLAGRALNRLLRLTERLDLASATSTGFSCTLVDVDVRALAQTVLARMQAAEPRSSLTVELKGNAQWMSDPRLLGAALSELVSNAFKFARTRMTIRIEPDALIVEDDGAGVKNAELAELLSQGKPGMNGLGLGLPLADALARRLGLTLALSTCEPSGTRSRFELRR